MLRYGGTHRSPSDFKDSKERHNHDKVPNNSHTSIHLANYTEKSLLVLKNYVFMEKNQRESSNVFGGQGDAFMSEELNGGGNIDTPTVLWENTKINKRSDKTITKKKTCGKPRSWMPNGGGIKPYNSPEAQKIVAPEECIIDVKAVKPKVDTWFRMKPKNITKAIPQDIQRVNKTNKDVVQPQKVNFIRMQRAATTMVKHVRERVEENRKDKTVKNLTSFWNDHLQKHPLYVAQKSTMAEPRKQISGGPAKPNSRQQMIGRPKSVGSDGVIQEHTLQPSKILSGKKKKLTSVEDILVFARLSGSRKSEEDGPNMGKQPILNGKRRPDSEKSSKDNLLKKIVPPPINTKTTSSVRTSMVKRPRRRFHPKFVVRLHPRWILALRVLTLSFRPLMNSWKQNCCPQVITAGVLKTTDVDKSHSQQTSIVSGKIIKETLATGVKRCSERFGKLKRLARQGMSDTLRILTNNKLRRIGVALSQQPFAVVSKPQPPRSLLAPSSLRAYRLPIVTEPMSLSASFAVTGSGHMKMASLDVLPRGVRVVLYVEYHLVFLFILVQMILLVIVLFIKWLQEYTM